jgi:hypothetical protein
MMKLMRIDTKRTETGLARRRIVTHRAGQETTAIRRRAGTQPVDRLRGTN